MDFKNILNIQHQIKENSEDLQKYLLDLESWEKEMKQKEEELKLIQATPEEEIPPIRNTLYRPKRKNKHKKQKEKVMSTSKTLNPVTDYQSWEKFDAEAEIKKIDEDAKQSSASETSENEDFSTQHRQQLAVLHKDKGNHFFKIGNYDSAINSYTTGLQLDPENPLLAANRAMAFLKKEQFQAAENDCNLCLSIDPTYVKAYLRRGTARKNLKKFLLAKDDFSRALELEPENKQAQAELKKLTEMFTENNASDLSEKESDETQDLWPQFLGNKPVKLSEESSQLVNGCDLSTKNNDCIFPDSPSTSPIKISTGISDLGSRIKTDILELNEDDFFEVVESRMNEMEEKKRNGQKIVVNNASQSEEYVESIISKPNLPPLPVNSFQFLNDWNEITPYADLRYRYLKQFPPEKFPVFFKHDMEPAVFPKLLETLSTSFIEHGDDVFDYMKYLTDIGRFQTLIMFLSDEEENDLRKLFEYMKTSGRPESEISLVLKKYGA